MTTVAELVDATPAISKISGLTTEAFKQLTRLLGEVLSGKTVKSLF